MGRLGRVGGGNRFHCLQVMYGKSHRWQNKFRMVALWMFGSFIYFALTFVYIVFCSFICGNVCVHSVDVVSPVCLPEISADFNIQLNDVTVKEGNTAEFECTLTLPVDKSKVHWFINNKEIEEIQVFHISLKLKSEVDSIITVIEKAIPYHIIFIISVEDAYMLYTSKKHNHVINEDNAVIDWTFKTDWLMDTNLYSINLKKDIDFVYTDFCNQITGNNAKENTKSVQELIEEESKLKKLNAQISKLEKAIKREKQFNRKVELNNQLQQLKKKL